MPRSNSDAGALNEATGTEPQKGTKWKKKWALLDKLWATVISFHRWPLAVIWLLRQRDGKIHVVPFEIFSCVMPTRAEYCQTTKAITPSCSSSHTPTDPGPAFDDERETRWGLPPNARLSCFIPYPTPPALYDWIHLVKCHPAPTSEGHIIFITPPHDATWRLSTHNGLPKRTAALGILDKRIQRIVMKGRRRLSEWRKIWEHNIHGSQMGTWILSSLAVSCSSPYWKGDAKVQ